MSRSSSTGDLDEGRLRRPEFESNHAPNVFKLHPLAARVHRGPEPSDQRAEPSETGARNGNRTGRAIVTLDSPAADPDVTPDRVPPAGASIDRGEEAEADSSSAPREDAGRIPSVIVVDRVGKLSIDLGKAAEGLVPEPEVLKLDRPAQIVEVAERQDPDVIVFSAENVTAAGLKRLAQVHKAQPKVVIVLSDNQKTWSAAQMAASGASDFLPANPTRARLRAKLEAALHTAEQLRQENIVVTERVVVHQAAAAESQPRAAAQTRDPGRVFTVASASGGSGKTVVATNLATYLVKATGGKVLLIDLDLQFGEVAPTLHLHPKRTIEDLARDPEDLSEALVEHACGFKTLCAPYDPLAGERITPDEISKIFDVARRQFDYVVVDTPPSLTESLLVAFDHSEKILITANMDVPSLKNMRRFLETLEKLDVAVSNTVQVINRLDSGIGIDLKGVSQLFPQGFLAVLPVAKEVPWATNMGVPMLHGDPKAEVSRQLAEGFMKLVPPAAGVTLPWQPGTPNTRKSGRMGIRKARS